MTSLPHASGTPHGQPDLQPASRSGSRHKDAFPPPPKSVRIWEVHAQSQDDAQGDARQAISSPVSSQSAKASVQVWVFLFLVGLVVIAAWLFVFPRK